MKKRIRLQVWSSNVSWVITFFIVGSVLLYQFHAGTVTTWKEVGTA